MVDPTPFILESKTERHLKIRSSLIKKYFSCGSSDSESQCEFDDEFKNINATRNFLTSEKKKNLPRIYSLSNCNIDEDSEISCVSSSDSIENNISLFKKCKRSLSLDNDKIDNEIKDFESFSLAGVNIFNQGEISDTLSTNSQIKCCTIIEILEEKENI